MRPLRAIRTAYHGWTNTLPARVIATTDTGHRVVVSVSAYIDEHAAHNAAAYALAFKLRWVKSSTDWPSRAGVYNGVYYWILPDVLD